MKCPCHNCGDRCIDCHATCSRYADFRKAQNEENALRLKGKQAYLDCYATNIELIRNCKKRGGRK